MEIKPRAFELNITANQQFTYHFSYPGGATHMLMLITYDVNTEDAGGRKRLRKVAKECVNYGQRVQNSVFECILDAAQYRLVKHKLEQLIDPEKDSLRFYNLGNNYKTKVEHIGAKAGYEPQGLLML